MTTTTTYKISLTQATFATKQPTKAKKNDFAARITRERDFQNREITAKEFALAISEGHAFTTWHKGTRSNANFELAQHIAVDFDSVPDCEKLINHDFVREYAAIWYDSLSSTTEARRMRVIFLLPTPITDPEEYQTEVKAVLWRLREFNPDHCSDLCRLFFGGYQVVRQPRELPNAVLTGLIADYERARVATIAEVEVEVEVETVARPAPTTDQAERAAYSHNIAQDLIDEAGKAANGYLKHLGEWGDYTEWCKAAANANALDRALTVDGQSSGYFYSQFCDASRRNAAYRPEDGKKLTRDFPKLNSVSLAFERAGLRYSIEKKQVYDPAVGIRKNTTMQEPAEDYDGPIAEAERILRGKPSGPGPDLLQFDATDVGNRDALLALFPQKYHHTTTLGTLFYNDTYWQTELADVSLNTDMIEVFRARTSQARARIDEIAKELADLSTQKDGKLADLENRAKALELEQKKLGKILAGCREDTPKINNSKTQVIQAPSVATTHERFDGKETEYLINTVNGVIDIRTGNLIAHNPSQYFTYCIPTPFDPEADPTRWLNFIEGAIAGSADVFRFFQMAVGYSLTADTRENCCFVFYGKPRSGKGTILSTLQHLLGKPLADSANYSSISARRDGNDPRFDMAGFRSTRFLVVGESSDGKPLNAAYLKTLTGDDSINVQYKYKDAFSYQPTFKLWLQSNFQINGDPDDDALWERIKPFEFPYGHIGEDCDKSLKLGMKNPDVLKGILAWAVAGARMWYASPNGLNIPAEVRDLASKHRDAADHVGDWLTDCEVEFGEYSKRDERFTPAAEVRKSYEAWCAANGVRPKAAKRFNESLLKKGYTPQHQVKIAGRTVKGVRGLLVNPESNQ
jgi:P4 family phage/plasmid primase-like protien